MNPFAAIFVPDELAAALSDHAWLQAMLDVERALATANGFAPGDEYDAGRYDIDALARAGRAAGNPVEPLVRAIREHVGEANAGDVHRGATSQDILDSAAMLVTRNALRLVDAEVEHAANACAALADAHRGTVLAARTLLQQAVPTTFGYKAAGWLVGLVHARARLGAVVLPAQLGGAAGTLAALGGDGVKIQGRFAAELDLAEPTLPWHTIRTPITDLAGALAGAAATIGKVATDIVLLAQTEVGEVSERDRGASSTMPHKRNPVAAVLAIACVRHARANSALLFECAVQEHERAAGAWHAEWAALTTALAATGGAAASIGRSLAGLEVHAERMRANIDAGTLSEAERFGFDVSSPEDYLGSADAFIDRALALHRG